MDISATVSAHGVLDAVDRAAEVELSSDQPLAPKFYSDFAWALIAAGNPKSAQFAAARSPQPDAVVTQCAVALLADDWTSALSAARSVSASAVSTAALATIETRAVEAYCRVYRGATAEEARAHFGIKATATPQSASIGVAQRKNDDLLAAVAQSALVMRQPVDRFA